MPFMLTTTVLPLSSTLIMALPLNEFVFVVYCASCIVRHTRLAAARLAAPYALVT